MSDKPKETRVLYLDDKNRIVFANMNFVLEKYETIKNKRTGDESDKWTFRGYFSNVLKNALSAYAKNEILEHPNPTVENLLKRMDEIEETIKNIDVSQIKLEVQEEA